MKIVMCNYHTKFERLVHPLPPKNNKEEIFFLISSAATTLVVNYSQILPFFLSFCYNIFTIWWYKITLIGMLGRFLMAEVSQIHPI